MKRRDVGKALLGLGVAVGLLPRVKTQTPPPLTSGLASDEVFMHPEALRQLQNLVDDGTLLTSVHNVTRSPQNMGRLREDGDRGIS